MARKQRSIQILNPVAGSGYTSYSKAQVYVRRGLASIIGGKLRFNVEHPAYISAVRTLHHGEGSGIATLPAVAGLPCLMPSRLLTGRRPLTPPVDHSHVVLTVRALPPEEW